MSSREAAANAVRRGQVWRDNHPAEQGRRTVRVLGVYRDIVVREKRGDYAEVITVTSNRRSVGKITWIRLDRFNPNRQTGYTLVKDVAE